MHRRGGVRDYGFECRITYDFSWDYSMSAAEAEGRAKISHKMCASRLRRAPIGAAHIWRCKTTQTVAKNGWTSF